MIDTQRKHFILSVEDDTLFQRELCQQLSPEFEMEIVSSLKQAREILLQRKFDILLLDRFLPDGDSVSLISELKSKYPDTCILLLTSDRDFTSTHQALEFGASNYLVKPPTLFVERGRNRHAFIDDLICQIGLARKHLTLERQNEILQNRIHGNSKHIELIGRSASIQNLKSQIRKYRGLKTPILILGESGTGKELVAQLLHKQEGPNRPFIMVNCSAIADNLAESHLFGQVKGGYTGASENRKGFLEQANGGDLFLDEVGDIPYAIQVKLLRAIEYGEYSPVGSMEVKRSQFRLISATHRNLQQMIYENQFRSDFYYRINGIQIKTEPLRARTEDILDLAPYFLIRQAGSRFSIPKETMKYLQNLPWTGNVRDLKHSIERAYANNRDRNPSEIYPEDIEADNSAGTACENEAKIPLPRSAEDVSPQSYADYMKTAEKLYYERTLQLCEQNLSFTHLKLGISRTTIYQKLRELGIGSKNNQRINEALSQVRGLTTQIRKPRRPIRKGISK
jgi:DNA-binding NtrC family response regulator